MPDQQINSKWNTLLANWQIGIGIDIVTNVSLDLFVFAIMATRLDFIGNWRQIKTVGGSVSFITGLLG